MSFHISDKQLLKMYNRISKRVGKLWKKKINSDSVYGDNDKYIKTKIKTYVDNVITNFHGKNIPKENEPRKSLSLKMLNSVIKAKKKYYPQTHLKECKYEPKKIKMENLINDDLEKSLSNKSDNDSNDEAESDKD